MKLSKFIFPLAVFSFSMVSCVDSDKTNDKKDSTEPNNNQTDADVVKVGNRLFSIPSPVQTSILVKASGAEYDKSLLNDDKASERYDTKTLKSVNLGIYGADLGYVNLYGQTQDAVNYLNAAKNLSDDLGVTSAFSEEFITQFQDNLGNTDSLLLIVSDAYQIIDEYLQNNENNDVGGLVLAGGWIEALYFTTQVYKTNPTKELKQRIGEQKFSIVNLVKMLNSYNNDMDEYQDLVSGLEDLQNTYDAVEVTYEYAEPEVFEEKKLSIIKNKTEVNLNDAIIKDITEKIASIRTNITQ